jgi:hypothetical protein
MQKKGLNSDVKAGGMTGKRRGKAGEKVNKVFRWAEDNA